MSRFQHCPHPYHSWFGLEKLFLKPHLSMWGSYKILQKDGSWEWSLQEWSDNLHGTWTLWLFLHTSPALILHFPATVTMKYTLLHKPSHAICGMRFSHPELRQLFNKCRTVSKFLILSTSFLRCLLRFSVFPLLAAVIICGPQGLNWSISLDAFSRKDSRDCSILSCEGDK